MGPVWTVMGVSRTVAVQPTTIDAQQSATPASVAATPPCSATPFQRQLDVRHAWQLKGDRCDRAFYGGCSAILLLHLNNPRILRRSAATCVARQGVPLIALVVHAIQFQLLLFSQAFSLASSKPTQIYPPPPLRVGPPLRCLGCLQRGGADFPCSELTAEGLGLRICANVCFALVGCLAQVGANLGRSGAL